MVYQTFRPSNLPYRTDEWGGLFAGASSGPAPSFYGDGSWADDNDATSVGLVLPGGSGAQASAAVAVTFDPIPTLTDNPNYGIMVRARMPTVYSSPLLNIGLGTTDGAGMVTPQDSLFPPFDVNTPIPTPQTYTTSTDAHYSYAPHSLMRVNPFVLAFQFQCNDVTNAGDAVRLYEVALLLDVAATYTPPLTVFPRDDGAECWPPPTSYQASGDVFGGYW